MVHRMFARYWRMLRSLCRLVVVLVAGSVFATYDVGYETDNETVTFDGTTFATNGIQVGYKGNSNLVQIINGAEVFTSESYIGVTSYDNYAGDGIPADGNRVDVSGSGSSWQAGQLRVGFGHSSYNNELRILGGGSVIAQSCLIGVYAGLANQITVSGAGSVLTVLNSGDFTGFTIGYRGGGHSLVVSNGASVVSASAVLGYGHNIYNCFENSAVVTGSGSTWTTGQFKLGTGEYAERNRLQILDGAHVSSDAILVGLSGSVGNSALISGVDALWIATSLNLTAVDNSAEANSITIEDGGALQIDGPVVLNEELQFAVENLKASELNVDDGGTLDIHGGFDAGQAGFNFNSGGTLRVSGSLTGLDTVETGRRLEANSVAGNLWVNGTFASGIGATNAVVTGNLTLSSSGILEFEMDDSAQDYLTVAGNLVLGGRFTLTFDPGVTLDNGDILNLFDWQGTIAGTFDDVMLPELGSGLSWDTTSLNTMGQLEVIPEPATAGLMGLSALCLYMMRINRGQFGTCRCFLRLRRSKIRTPVAEGW